MKHFKSLSMQLVMLIFSLAAFATEMEVGVSEIFFRSDVADGCAARLEGLSPRLRGLAAYKPALGHLLIQNDGDVPFDGILPEFFRGMEMTPQERRQVLKSVRLYMEKQVLQGRWDRLRGLERLLRVMDTNPSDVMLSQEAFGLLRTWINFLNPHRSRNFLFVLDSKFFVLAEEERVRFVSPIFTEEMDLAVWSSDAGRRFVLKRYYREMLQRQRAREPYFANFVTDGALDQLLDLHSALRTIERVAVRTGRSPFYSIPRSFKDILDAGVFE